MLGSTRAVCLVCRLTRKESKSSRVTRALGLTSNSVPVYRRRHRHGHGHGVGHRLQPSRCLTNLQLRLKKGSQRVESRSKSAHSCRIGAKPQTTEPGNRCHGIEPTGEMRESKLKRGDRQIERGIKKRGYAESRIARGGGLQSRWPSFLCRD